MKIVHLCLSSFYIEGFGYQENLIPKYNKKDGHDVSIIASRFSYDKKNGEPCEEVTGEYINSYGIKVIRIDYKHKGLKKINPILKQYEGTYKLLEKERPNLIFMHGIQFYDIKEVIRYVKNNPKCELVGDIHASYDNSAQNFASKYILHKLFWRQLIKESLPFIKKIFPIAPGCEIFAKEMYKIPSEKMEYLYLGADSDKINTPQREHIRNSIREKFDIKQEDLVLITGGKLTRSKNTDLLLNAFKRIESTNIKLIIFGSFADDIREHLLEKIKSDSRVKYIGWLNAEDVYDYYLASDIAIFPGSKSALWEQAIGSSLPLICKKWKGMEYVDVGGNCLFLTENSEDEIVEKVELLQKNDSLRSQMKQIAEVRGYETFSYESISRKAIRMEMGRSF